MLELDVVLAEEYDEKTGKFVLTKQRIQLEHSLASLSKWESVFEKPFMGMEKKTPEETFAYIEMMIQGEKPSPEVLLGLVRSHHEEIQSYIDRKMTGTKISEIQKSQGRRGIITSEVIYSWMVEMNIPFETQHWHFNRLIMLIRVISVNRAPKKTMTAAERQSLMQKRRREHSKR